MPAVDWSYHRKNCNSCSKAAAFLNEHQISVKAQVDARATAVMPADALRLVKSSRILYVTRGTKIMHFDLTKERPDDELLLELMVGRSGKLRAPALQVGQTLIVGFDQETYERVFLGSAR